MKAKNSNVITLDQFKDKNYSNPGNIKNGINWKKDIVNNFSKVWNFGKVELRKVYNAYACSVTSIFRILSS